MTSKVLIDSANKNMLPYPFKRQTLRQEIVDRYFFSQYGRMYSIFIEVETLFRLIDEIIITSLQAVQKIIINDKHCFELYPFRFNNFIREKRIAKTAQIQGILSLTFPKIWL